MRYNDFPALLGLQDFDEQELITSSIRHPNIVQLMGFTFGPRPAAPSQPVDPTDQPEEEVAIIIMEYCSGLGLIFLLIAGGGGGGGPENGHKVVLSSIVLFLW